MRDLLAIEQGRKEEEEEEEDPFKDTETDLFQKKDEPYLDPSTGAIPKKKVLNPEIKFNDKKIKVLTDEGFIRPLEFGNTTELHLNELLKRTNKEIQFTTGTLAGLGKKKNKTQKDKDDIELAKERKEIFKDYKKVLSAFLTSLEYQTGRGIYFNNPHQLLNRLELLAGSILAGNNGVIPEFSQLVHFLNQMNVITKKQLNDLLKNYLSIK